MQKSPYKIIIEYDPKNIRDVSEINESFLNKIISWNHPRLRTDLIYYIPRQKVHDEEWNILGKQMKGPKVFCFGLQVTDENVSHFERCTISTLTFRTLCSKHYGIVQDLHSTPDLLNLPMPQTCFRDGDIQTHFEGGACIVDPIAFKVVRRNSVWTVGEDSSIIVIREANEYQMLPIFPMVDFGEICSDFQHFEVLNDIEYSEDGTSLIKFPRIYRKECYDIPNQVRRIEDCAFKDCISYVHVNIPPTVTYIGDCALDSQYLTIYIPYTLYDKFKSQIGAVAQLNIGVCPYMVDFIPSPFGSCSVKDFPYEKEMCATPNYGYEFVKWSDGNTNNPRTIILHNNLTIGADFAPSAFCLNVTTNPSGTAQLSYPKSNKYRSLASITISPNFGFDFICWEDGEKSLARSVLITRDTNLVAKLRDMRCGESLRWRFENGRILRIEGKGLMYDFISNSAPWHEHCKEINELILPEGLTHIGANAFAGMDHLQSVIIPDSVVSIGDNAFDGCVRLSSITIGRSVEEIGATAFKGCIRIEEMTLLPQITPVVQSDTLESINSIAYLNVSNGFARKYKIDPNWSRFDIREIEE